MAEVKTYKCDICGEVYHVDENDKEFINISLRSRLDGDDLEKLYDHICPDCEKTICHFIQRPSSFNDLKSEAGCLRKVVNRLHNYIWRLKRTLDTDTEYSLHFADRSDESTYQRIIDETLVSYIKLEKSRTRWMRIAVIAIGCFVGLLLGVVF